MKNRNIAHKDEWSTPIDFYEKLDSIYHFDFDPCPLSYDEITDDNNGLLINWGRSNFINPPYSRKLKDAFVLKAIEESKKGKLCVMLLPVSTSTKLFHDHILPNATKIEFVRGRIGFIGINSFGVASTGKQKPMHDSMIVVFGNILM
jgi:phage N-6-adenine-methyltransferase